jgi:hypothetical protein
MLTKKPLLPNRKAFNPQPKTAVKNPRCGYGWFGEEKLLTSLRFEN